MKSSKAVTGINNRYLYNLKPKPTQKMGFNHN